MTKKIITISREFGSGGRSIAKMLAERLHYNYYDKELVERVAEETGFDKKYIEENGEFAQNKNFFSFALSQGVSSATNGLTVSDFLWCVQRDIILKLAEKGSCVIVGRCADYILRDNPDCFNVFIHADDQFRADRIVRLYGESEKKPQQRLKEKDKKRKINYKHYTEQDWGMSQNYDLCLDSSTIGLENCVDIILKAIECKNANK